MLRAISFYCHHQKIVIKVSLSGVALQKCRTRLTQKGSFIKSDYTSGDYQKLNITILKCENDLNLIAGQWGANETTEIYYEK